MRARPLPRRATHLSTPAVTKVTSAPVVSVPNNRPLIVLAGRTSMIDGRPAAGGSPAFRGRDGQLRGAEPDIGKDLGDSIAGHRVSRGADYQRREHHPQGRASTRTGICLPHRASTSGWSTPTPQPAQR